MTKLAISRPQRAHLLREAIEINYSPIPAGACFAVVLALLSAACTAGGGPGSGVLSVDTLPNGAVRVQNGVVGQLRRSVDWRPVELLRLGAVDDSDLNYVFGDVWDVTLDGKGRLYVLDRQSKNVRVFAETGEHIRTLGRGGGGPGEFNNPIGLTWDGNGHLWVVDVHNARYSVFDTSGAFVRTHPRQVLGYGYPWGGGFDRVGAHLYEPGVVSDPTSGERRSVYLRQLITASVVVTDTFELPSPTGDSEDSSYRVDGENAVFIVPIPYAAQHRWVFDGEGGFWSGMTDQYRFYYTSLNGDTLRVVEAEYDPVPIEDDDLAEYRQRYDEFGQQHVAAILGLTLTVKPALRWLPLGRSIPTGSHAVHWEHV